MADQFSCLPVDRGPNAQHTLYVSLRRALSMGGSGKKKSGKRHTRAGCTNITSDASKGKNSSWSKGMSELTVGHVEIAGGKEKPVGKHVQYQVLFH
jgi:hypothetical protein